MNPILEDRQIVFMLGILVGIVLCATAFMYAIHGPLLGMGL